MSTYRALYSVAEQPDSTLEEHGSGLFGADRLPDLFPYPDPVPERGWVRGAMLSTVDGSVTGPDGLSGSISGPPDRQVFAMLRHTSDAVLVGLGTARAEGYKRIKPRPAFAARRAAAGQQPAPTLAVVTGSGVVPDELLEHPDGHGELLVLISSVTAADRADALRARLGEESVVVAGEDRVEPDAAVETLATRGLRRISCEGGPTWLGLLSTAGRLDELCLTTSPLIVGGTAGRILHSGYAQPCRLALRTVLASEDMLFTRWVVDHSPTAE